MNPNSGTGNNLADVATGEPSPVANDRGEPLTQCPKCLINLSERAMDQRKQHIRRCNAPPPLPGVGYACNVCDKHFDGYAGVRQHMKRAHPVEYNKADVQLMEERMPKTRGVYTESELRKIARYEVSLPPETLKSVKLTAEALSVLVNRSVEGLKKVRRRDDYIQMVASARETERTEEISPDPVPIPAADAHASVVKVSTDPGAPNPSIEPGCPRQTRSRRTQAQQKGRSTDGTRTRGESCGVQNSSETRTEREESPSASLDTQSPEGRSTEGQASRPCEVLPVVLIQRVDDPTVLIESKEICLTLRIIRDEVSQPVRDLIDSALTESDPHLVLPMVDAYILSLHADRKGPGGKRKRKKRSGGMAKPLKGNRAKRRTTKYALYQKAYHRNPAEVAAAILKGQNLDETIEGPSMDEAASFFTKTYSPHKLGWEPRKPSAQPKNDISHPITLTEVIQVVKDMSESAAGPDGLGREEIRRAKSVDLQAVFNIIWGMKRLTPLLKTNRTVLLPKSGDLKDPKNWRPITISCRLLRLLQQIITKRLENVVKLSHTQQGFTRKDGTLINNVILQTVIKRCRRKGKPLIVMSIDLAKAFDRVNLTSIIDALRQQAVDEHTIAYVQANYEGITTVLECQGEKSNPIPILRGTKQGDPMSGLLFNIVINDLLRQLQDLPGVKLDEANVSVLAFADDIVLLSEDVQSMESKLLIVEKSLNHHGLEVNVAKCNALQLLRVPGTKRTAVVTTAMFTIGGHKVPTLATEDQMKYLGLQYSHLGVAAPSVEKLVTMLGQLKSAPLKPWQKLYVVQKHVIPMLYHSLQCLTITAGRLKAFDGKIKKFVKDTLHLPLTTPDAYLYAPQKHGGLGLQNLTISVASTFQRRLEKAAMVGDPAIQAALASAEVGTLRGRLSRATKCLLGPEPRHVRDYWRKRAEQAALLTGFQSLEVPSQWLNNPPDHWSKSDFTRASLLRVGLLPTMSTPYRTSECRNISCRESETLYHIIQRCPVTHYSRVNRHDTVNKCLTEEIRQRFPRTIAEPVIKGRKDSYKPDIAVVQDQTTYIIETTVAYESFKDSLLSAYAHKMNKYSCPAFQEEVNRRFSTSNVTVLPFVVGARGGWLPSNDAVVALFGLKADIKQRICNTVVQWGASIHRQFNATVWRLSKPGLSRKIDK